jgi:flagellar hook protein FlgE
MSLYSAMRAGVSGLFAQTQSMAMISDNIANVSTNGYKLVRSSFNSLITIQGNNGAYTAGSVRALPKRGIDVAGSLSSSNNPLDLSIVGEGFFAVTDRLEEPTNADTGRGSYYTPNGEIVYSRNGEFRRDANGNLRNPAGYYLLGWPVIGTDSNGQPNYDRTNLPSTLTAVSVKATTGRPQPSKNLTLNANIDSKLLQTGKTFDVTMNIYDRQGTLRTLRVSFEPLTGGYRYPATGTAVIEEAFAYKVSMKFEGTNSPQFRSGRSESSGFIASFTSTGQFKSFLQPVLEGGTPLEATKAAGSDGSYTAGGGAHTVGANLRSQRGMIPPLYELHGLGRVQAQLSPTDTTGNEEWWDLGAVANDGTNDQYLGYATAGGTTARPDLRILGVPTANNDPPYFDLQGTTAADDEAAYGQAVVFDVDFGRDGFQFNGEATDPNLTEVYDNDVQIKLNFGSAGTQDGLTHYNSPSAITNITQDGFTIGQLEGVQISESGIVTAVYDNGDRKEIAQVPVVSFNSPNNLELANGNAYRQSEASGQAVVRFPGTSGVGTLAPSTVETSNVDIAEEFTHMIVTQRAYSASTKIITTADEMLDELIRAKR